jgi:hypothetical protein
MKTFEEKLQALELRALPAELKQRVLENATISAVAVKEKDTKRVGMLMSLATSKWFLFLVLPLLSIGSIGAFAIALEERGADRRWEEVEKRLADAGESLDFESFFAPPVPDAQNFMGTPALKGLELRRSVDSRERKHERFEALPDLRPPRPSQPDGEPLDLSKWEILDANNEVIGTLGEEPERMVLELLGKDPALFEELAAAAQRPFSQPATPIGERLAGDSVWELTLAHLGILQKLAKVTSLRALAAARLGNRERARESLAIHFKCRDCAFADGGMINGLVGMTIRSILEARLPDLLRETCWTDDDLRWLQEKVAEGDGFEEGLRMFRSEMAFTAHCYDEMLGQPRRRREMFGLSEGDRLRAFTLTYLIPDGIYHRNKATSVQWVYQYGVEPFKARDVQSIRTTEHRLQEELASLSWFSLGSIFAAKSIPGTGTISGKLLASEMQRRMMETGVALERYRRAEGAFPSGLEQLVPDYLGAIPKDLAADVPGTPIRYTREGSGYQLMATPISTKGEVKTRNELKFIR